MTAPCEGPLHDGADPPCPSEGWLEHRRLVPRSGLQGLPTCEACFQFALFHEPGLWAWSPYVEAEPLLGVL